MAARPAAAPRSSRSARSRCRADARRQGQGRRPAAEAATIARLRDRLRRPAPPRRDHPRLRSEPSFAAPAAAYAARSGDPVLFHEAESLPQATIAALRRDEGVPVYALGPGSAISGKVLKEVEGCKNRGDPDGAAPTRSPGRSPSPLRRRRLRLERLRPRPRFVTSGRRAARSRRRGAALGLRHLAPCCSPTAPIRSLRIRGYFLDVEPGYATDPTRAFYNHVWIVGDAGQISVEQQAEVNEVAELAKIGTEE